MPQAFRHSLSQRGGPFGRISGGAGVSGGKPADLFAHYLLGETDVIGGLKIEPELRRVAKPVAEAKRGVAGDAPQTMDDLGDAVGRHLDLAGELGRGDAKLLQFVGEDFAGMNGRSCHR